MRNSLGLLLALALVVPGAPAEAKRVALLVGISNYQVEGIPPLEGPGHDVAALRDVLRDRWGFAGADIHTLVDRQATRNGILAELDALQGRSAPGDELFIYFSGHGTSALDRDLDELDVPHGSGAFVAHEFNPYEPGSGGLIVGRRDLIPRIEALERGQRSLWVVTDSCYSGQAVRERRYTTTADTDRWPLRSFQVSLAKTAAAVAAPSRARPAAPPYPYKATSFLAAAAEGETAKDVGASQLQRWPTIDGRPHGALTDALLRVLHGQLPADLNGDGLLDLHEVHRAVSDFMARRPYGHTPQRLPSVADDANGLGRRPVLSVRGVAVAPADKPPAPLAISTEGLPGTLSQRLETLPDVRLTPQAQADLVVRLAGQELDVIDASGDRLQMLPASDTNRLIGQIRQLAWAKRLRALAERHRRGVLPVDIEPDGYGGNLLVGQQLTFALRPAQPGWLVMVNVAADGTITVLHPVGTFQTVALPAGALWRSPGQRVQPPEGKDLQFMLLFDGEPTDLANLVKLARSTDPDHIERVQATLERMVSAESRRFVFGHTEFRTWLAANRK